MDKRLQKRLVAIGLKTIRELAMNLYESHPVGLPQGVYNQLMGLVEKTLEAELEVVRWAISDGEEPPLPEDEDKQ